MKEVFVKIIERLEAVEEQLYNARESIRKDIYKDREVAEYSKKLLLQELAYYQAIEIVKEVAEEYSNSEKPNKSDGWIPCSERLPQENGYYLITIKYYHLHNNVTMGCFFDDGEWYKIDNDDNVLAWQPLPEPYKPKGE